MKRASFAPLYCALYPDLAEIFKAHGYALAVHGSLQRDFDLVAVPWTDSPSTPDAVVADVVAAVAFRQVGVVVTRQHGRMVYTLSAAFGDCFFDLSFMPTVPLPSTAPPVVA